ncbi:TPA: hypothetical protein KGE55_000002 [Escherichia coli]|nr:hypothetical protein [Escherichia coli]HBD0199383.1 hypothetical protein [Escherichia coli]
MHQSGSVSLCRSAISVLVATALYSPIALASTVEYGETVDGVVLEKDIQLVYGTANNIKRAKLFKIDMEFFQDKPEARIWKLFKIKQRH